MNRASKPRNPRSTRGFWFAGLLLCSGLAVAQPYRPTDDSLVLERLPAQAPAAAVATADAALAARAARVYVERGRRSGDPRQYGYAQGLLQPWWDDADASDEILLLRATLRQHRHDFDAALADLQRLLTRNSAHAQAWLTRATILRVRGDYDAAAIACAQLHELVEPAVARLCALSVQSLRDPQAALQELARIEAAIAAQPVDVVAWYYAERAAAAERVGDAVAAEAAYRAGLTRAPWDIGLRAAGADLLLARSRPREALEWVAQDETVDALRLRELLALQALGDARAIQIAAQLADGFAAARRRGDVPHLRAEARYRLDYVGDAPGALALMLESWQSQREPEDARLLLATARAAKSARAESMLREWLKRSGLRDPQLELPP